MRAITASLRSTMIRALSLIMGGLLVSLICLEVFQVFLRYFLSDGFIWGRDMATLMVFGLAWLGAPLLWLQHSHLAVDLLPKGFSGSTGFAIVLNGVMLVSAIALAIVTSWAIRQFSFIDLPTLGVTASIKFFPAMAGTILLILAAFINLVDGQTDD